MTESFHFLDPVTMNIYLLLVLLSIGVTCIRAENDDCNNANDATNCSDLHRAQALQAPIPTSTLNGETEASDFWEHHSLLLKRAWEEWESLQDLPNLNMENLLNKTLLSAVDTAWKDAQKEDDVKDLWEEVAPNVYKSSFFDPHQLHSLRTHLDQASFHSNIPTRRPNGMNRYGLILHPSKTTDGGVHLQEFSSFLEQLLDSYIRPMGRALFPEYVSKENKDDVNAYAFLIRYQQDQDVSLQQHSDASLYTLNVNLNLPEEEYQGSSLYFVDLDQQHHNVTLEPGEALLHLGMTRHASLPIQGGSRTNMVVWLFGKQGDVRIAPYDEHEQRTREERWSNYNDEQEEEFGFEL